MLLPCILRSRPGTLRGSHARRVPQTQRGPNSRPQNQYRGHHGHRRPLKKKTDPTKMKSMWPASITTMTTHLYFNPSLWATLAVAIHICFRFGCRDVAIIAIVGGTRPADATPAAGHVSQSHTSPAPHLMHKAQLTQCPSTHSSEHPCSIQETFHCSPGLCAK